MGKLRTVSLSMQGPMLHFSAKSGINTLLRQHTGPLTEALTSLCLYLEIIFLNPSATSCALLTENERVTQSYLTLCSPVDLPDLSMEFSRQETLEWVANPFSRGSSKPRDGTQVFFLAGRFFTI